MTTTVNNGPLAAETKPKVGPGSLLKDARIANGLGIDDIAIRLRLHTRIIQGIERDDYEHLPPPTFVRGYLRGYARIVGRSSVDIIEAYEKNSFSIPLLVSDISHQKEVKSSDLSIKLTTCVVIALSCSLLVLWWQNNRDTHVTTPPIPITIESVESDDSDQMDLSSTPKTTAAPLLTNENTKMLRNTDETPSVNIGDGSVSGFNSVNITSHPIPLQSPLRSARRDSVSLIMSKDSWLEIYNAYGERIYYDLARAGSAVNIIDIGPFKLIIGYAKGAILRYNDKPIDLDEFTVDGMAKLTLGGSTDN